MRSESRASSRPGSTGRSGSQRAWPRRWACRIRSAAAVAALAVSKQRQREALAKAGVPQPTWHLVREPQEGLPVPSVVKAPDRQGQKGLTLVRSEAELPDAIARAIEESRSGAAHRRGARRRARGDRERVLASRRVPSADRDRPAHCGAAGVRCRARACLAERGGWRRPPESPSRPSPRSGSRTAPRYTQLRIGPEGPQVIEVAARLGGGHDAELATARARRRPERPRAPGRARRADLVGRAERRAAGRRRRRALPRAT